MGTCIDTDGGSIETLNADAGIKIIEDGTAEIAASADGDVSIVISGDVDEEMTLQDSGEFGIYTRLTDYDAPEYTGETVITPSEETQILQTQGKLATENIIVNPIPANYGRIIYDGTHLRIE